MKLHCAERVLDLSQPAIMGVLNLTPDSFFDGGQFIELRAAVAHAAKMVEEGAVIIDVGGESTRPGAEPVSEQQELDRVLPVVERLVAEVDAVISIDTMKPAVMGAACAMGAHMINDVRALRAPHALQAAQDGGAAVCLMHMQGEPRTMQHSPQYADVMAEVRAFLSERILACEAAGIDRARIVVDPGFGFGKSLAHNLSMLANLDALADLQVPLMVGMSRKSMLGTILDGAPADQRLFAGVAAAALAVWQGAAILRTHDVAATRDALLLATAVRDARTNL